MQGLVAGPAAAAYLASIPAEIRQAASDQMRDGEIITILHLLTLALVCLALVSTGALSRFRLVNQFRTNGWVMALWCPAATGLAAFAAIAVVDGLWTLATGRAVAAQGFALWGWAAMIAAPFAYAVARRCPKSWWLWAGGAVAVLSVGLSLAASSAQPPGLAAMPEGAAHGQLTALAQRAGLPNARLLVSTEPALDADVQGSGDAPEIIVSRGLLERGTPPQIASMVGHVAGHFVHWDAESLTVLAACLCLGWAAAVRFLFPFAVRPMAKRPAIADPAGLPVVLLITLGYLVVATLAYDFCLREVNVRADAFALDVTGRSDGLIQTAIMTNGARTVDPNAVEEFLFFSHPSLNSRIVQALAWRAARP